MWEWFMNKKINWLRHSLKGDLFDKNHASRVIQMSDK